MCHKRTLPRDSWMSALCQKADIMHCSEERRYSITSSAMASSDGGMVKSSISRIVPALMLVRSPDTRFSAASLESFYARLPADGSNAEHELAQFAREGIDVHVLANQLQEEGAKSFVKSWNDLMSVINSKTAVLERASDTVDANLTGLRRTRRPNRAEPARTSPTPRVLVVDVGGTSFCRSGLRLRGRTLDDQGPNRRGCAGSGPFDRALRTFRRSPTSCSPPCAMNLGVM